MLDGVVVCDPTADVVIESADAVVELTAEAVLVVDAGRVAFVAACAKLVFIPGLYSRLMMYFVSGGLNVISDRDDEGEGWAT